MPRTRSTGRPKKNCFENKKAQKNRMKQEKRERTLRYHKATRELKVLSKESKEFMNNIIASIIDEVILKGNLFHFIIMKPFPCPN